MTSSTSIRIALDWTPNTLHAGLILAQHLNLYSTAGLAVSLLSPGPDYTTTPAKRLERHEADLAIVPSESVIAYAESAKPDFELQAVYAICQRDASAIVSTRKDLARPKDLAEKGARYGSYNARYEDDIVRAMVAKDGGDPGKLQIAGSEGKLTLFEAVRKGDKEVDATWVFLPWEGVQAEMNGEELNVFRLEDYGVPYGYSPVIVRNAASQELDDDVLKRFVKATQEGYRVATNFKHRRETVEALGALCEPKQSGEFLNRSLEKLGPYLGTRADAFGRMEAEKWEKWVAWLTERQLVKKEIKVDALWTNKFFE